MNSKIMIGTSPNAVALFPSSTTKQSLIANNVGSTTNGRWMPFEDLKFGSNKETDAHKVEARMKQIAFGKNTVGYDYYTAAVPMEKRQRRPEHPTTPDAFEKLSKRDFAGRVQAWRRALHMWDEVDKRPDLGPRKRKNEDSASSTPPSSVSTNPFVQGASMVNKRQKLSSTPQQEELERNVRLDLDIEQEKNNNDKNGFMIGEVCDEIDDGYESEDVL